MPYSDPAARRAAHRRSDLKHRPRVLVYRKVRRAALRALGGSELTRLIAAQAADARRYRIKGGPEFWDVYRIEPGTYPPREAHRARVTAETGWDDITMAA